MKKARNEIRAFFKKTQNEILNMRDYYARLALNLHLRPGLISEKTPVSMLISGHCPFVLNDDNRPNNKANNNSRQHIIFKPTIRRLHDH
jgi:hypothetical protein